MELNDEVIHNYDTSILFLYGKGDAGSLCYLLSSWDSCPQNGIELILVTYDRLAKEALDYTVHYPLVNWRIITIPEDRFSYGQCFSALIEVCQKKYIILLDRLIDMDAGNIHTLRKYSMHYPDYCLTPVLENPPDILYSADQNVAGSFSLGPVLVKKEWLLNIEVSFSYAIPNLVYLLIIQSGLEYNGHFGITVHETSCRYIKKPSPVHFDQYKNIYHWFGENDPRTNKKVASAILFDWRSKPDLYRPLIHYVSKFKDYSVQSNRILTKKYKKILLAQCYNEKLRLQDFFMNMQDHFDGIIILDDDSTDGSYEDASHNKLLIKVKKERIGFNDLENRNILLNIASFFNTEWLCFMDLDERFDPRYCNFSAFEDSTEVQTVAFTFVHAWKGAHLYNASFPNSDMGFQQRFRMFRAMGRMQIATKSNLHFPTVPYFDNALESTILFIHLGNENKKLREKKYKFYAREDKQNDMKMYSMLVEKSDARLLPVKDITFRKQRFIAKTCSD